MVMLRKYCEVHDSLWAWGDQCESAAIEAENVSYTEECKFITVDLVKKPLWVVFE